MSVFGAPTNAARLLAESGVRHRRAYVGLGNAISQHVPASDLKNLKVRARWILSQNQAGWSRQLGELVYTNTLKDLA